MDTRCPCLVYQQRRNSMNKPNLDMTNRVSNCNHVNGIYMPLLIAGQDCIAMSLCHPNKDAHIVVFHEKHEGEVLPPVLSIGVHKSSDLDAMIDNLIRMRARIAAKERGDKVDATPIVPKLTKEQCVILTGYTGLLMSKLSDLHEDVERRVGYPVFTHQFGNKEFAAEIKKMYTPDFLKLVGAENDK